MAKSLGTALVIYAEFFDRGCSQKFGGHSDDWREKFFTFGQSPEISTRF